MSGSQYHPALAAGHLAVITGAASGIGLAAAQRLSRLGLRICLADREDAALQSAVATLGAGDHLAVVTDVTDAAAVDRLAETVSRQFGTVHVLMNKAGIDGGGDALSNPEGWQRVWP